MRCRTGFLVALCLVAYWTMAVSVSPRMGVTADEVVHLTGGYSYWEFNDYRLHPENGTLPMRLAALPLLGMDLRFPALDSFNWTHSKVNRVGDEFFFGLGNPYTAMVNRARLVIALLGAFTVWLTWRWARGLFGRRAGWLALVLAMFCPALLAHGGLATSDIALTACVIAALSLVWQLLHRATWTRLGLTTLACGAAFLAKMSGVLIVPLIGALLVLRWLRPVPFVVALGGRVRWLRRRTAIIGATLGLIVTVAAGSLVLLWGGYSFRFDAINRAVSQQDDYYFSWDVMLERAPLPWTEESSLAKFVTAPRPPQPTLMTKLIGELRDHRLLPDAYLWGFANTYKFAKERPAFLLGKFSKTGWREFFPFAFLLKTTLPALLLFAAGLAALAWTATRRAPRTRPWLHRAAPLVLFFIVYWAMALTMHLNIGHRHILPIYPVVYVFASAAVLWLAHRTVRWIAFALVAGVALHAADSLLARPFYLSYFQPLVGGSDRGYRYLVDSSLDWGQGLPDLAQWLGEKKASGDNAPVFLTYFGADSPRGRQLDVVRFGDEMNDAGSRAFPAQVRGGWFAISATHFQRIYLPVRNRWTLEHEQVYRELMRRLGDSAQHPPRDDAARARLIQDAKDYEVLQLGRLCHFVHERIPDRVLGGSLLLFRLTDAEVSFALYAPWERFQPYLP